MPELLFEIGVEELPALAIEPATSFMKTFLDDGLRELRLAHSEIKVLGTPRRLVVLIDELAVNQADLQEEIAGPSVNIAFDQDGKLSKAGLGFVRAKGLDESQVYHKSTDKGDVIAARLVMPGRRTLELLPELLIDMMRKIPFKKRMRWDGSGESFARPVRWLLCLFGGEQLPLAFADVNSGKESRGHRFMSPEPFVVTSNDQYLRELKNRYVVLSADEREAIFVKGAQEKLASIGARFHEDRELMSIVKNLVEYPFAILGQFEEKYLEIPSVILVSEMKTHQKSFAVYKQSGEMLPYFICSAGTLPYDEKVFAKGNARVLRARFEDGAFYFSEDRKKTLREQAIALGGLVFERELGTVADKSARIENVALSLAKLLHLNDQEISLIKKAAPILKADLVSGVVGQFPELQGIMGRIYAKLDKEEGDVAEVIETHYWPRFADDHLPRLKVAALLSIADRLDTLVGIIAIGKKPKGNKDPFALRRAAIGIVRMLVDFGFSIDLKTMISLAISSYGDRFKNKAKEVSTEAEDFIVQRARGLLIEDLGKESKDYAVNFADSVLAVGSSDLLDAFARAHTLYAMRNVSKDEFDSLTQAFKRASNIVKKAQQDSGDKLALDATLESYLSTPAEKDLVIAIKETRKLIDKDIDKHAGFESLRAIYLDVFSQVAMLKPKLATFFDNVMVMVDDAKVRNARLALLSEIKRVADKVADFTHL